MTFSVSLGDYSSFVAPSIDSIFEKCGIHYHVHADDFHIYLFILLRIVFFHLRSKLKYFEDMEKVVHAFRSSRFDHFNVLYLDVSQA